MRFAGVLNVLTRRFQPRRKEGRETRRSSFFRLSSRLRIVKSLSSRFLFRLRTLNFFFKSVEKEIALPIKGTKCSRWNRLLNQKLGHECCFFFSFLTKPLSRCLNQEASLKHKHRPFRSNADRKDAYADGYKKIIGKNDIYADKLLKKH